MLLAALVLFQTPLSSAEREARKERFGYSVAVDFQRFDPLYKARINVYKEKLERLQADLSRQVRRGRKSACSRQLLLEAHWLTHYTADYPRIEKLIGRLEAMLKLPKDPHTEKEQDADGSFGGCHESWFYKVDRTCDRLVAMQFVDDKPKRRLAFLDRINDPGRLRSYLNSVLISNVAKTGMDHRFELNLTATNLLRLINGHLPNNYAFDQRLKKTMDDWLKNVWQDPKTGFYGGWFVTPQGLRKTADLSCTFHVADYMEGKIGHWPEIIRTTLAMKDLEYPFGWLQEGKLSNHHDFDVVTLFRYGWPIMTLAQKKEAISAIRRMKDHCLKETLRPDGSFNMEDESTVGGSYVFPVQFLSEIGYFHREARFWTKESFPEAHALAAKIAARIEATGLDDPESQTALWLLKSAD